jgi:hypothetical protein
MSESQARQTRRKKRQNKKLTPIFNVPLQATNLVTPEGESYISQCIRPNSSFPVQSRLNAVRARVMNEFVKASRVIVMTIHFMANVT